MAGRRVLITGMSGTGKSSLLDELASRGLRTVDTDYGDYFETVDGERLWREDKIAALLDSLPAEPLFVQGTTRNQVRFYPRFDHIVLLSAPPEVLIQRLATRTTNPYGKGPAELAETLEYQRTVEPLLRASATLEVVTTIPVPQVADLVLGHVLLLVFVVRPPPDPQRPLRRGRRVLAAPLPAQRLRDHHRAGQRPGQVRPPGIPIPHHEGGADRTERVHRCAAYRSTPQPSQRDIAADTERRERRWRDNWPAGLRYFEGVRGAQVPGRHRR
jgi:shikimate kinase